MRDAGVVGLIGLIAAWAVWRLVSVGSLFFALVFLLLVLQRLLVFGKLPDLFFVDEAIKSADLVLDGADADQRARLEFLQFRVIPGVGLVPLV